MSIKLSLSRHTYFFYTLFVTSLPQINELQFDFITNWLADKIEMHLGLRKIVWRLKFVTESWRATLLSVTKPPIFFDFAGLVSIRLDSSGTIATC